MFLTFFLTYRKTVAIYMMGIYSRLFVKYNDIMLLYISRDKQLMLIILFKILYKNNSDIYIYYNLNSIN